MRVSYSLVSPTHTRGSARTRAHVQTHFQHLFTSFFLLRWCSSWRGFSCSPWMGHVVCRGVSGGGGISWDLGRRGGETQLPLRHLLKTPSMLPSTRLNGTVWKIGQLKPLLSLALSRSLSPSQSRCSLDTVTEGCGCAATKRILLVSFCIDDNVDEELLTFWPANPTDTHVT